MDTTVIVAIIGVAGTMLASFFVQIIELLKLRSQIRIDDIKETKKIQREWFREHNIERYAKVKNWVIDIVKAIELSPLNKREEEYPANSFEEVESLLLNLTLHKSEITILASGDEQLAKHLNSFIVEYEKIVNLRPEKAHDGRWLNWHDTDLVFRRGKEKVYSLSADIVNRIYELMLQSPKFERLEQTDELKKNKQQRDLYIAILQLVIFLVIMFLSFNWLHNNSELIRTWINNP